MKEPERGEIWLVDLGFLGKVRPCLVLSTGDVGERERALHTIVPHTTSLRGSKFEVSIAVRFLKPGGFDAQNLATVSRAKFIKRLGALTPAELDAVAIAIREWLRL